MIIPVIMSGGAGSRLWPLSKQAMPKQLLPLVGTDTMVQQTAARVSGEGFAPPVFICNAAHAAPIAAQMASKAYPLGGIITEPVGRNTAPVAVVAALHAQATDTDALVLLLPADHHVTKPDAFRAAVALAEPAARAGRLVTFGITPDAPETGYGYIEQAAELFGGCFSVKAFREKPDAATAQGYIDSGRFVWNAGIFLFSPAAFLAEIAKFAPDILSAATSAYESVDRDGHVLNLDADLFAACPPESIDYAVMEKTTVAAVVPCDIGWNDIGSFAALHDVNKDADGMAIPEDCLHTASTNCLVQSDGPRVALVGVDNIGVIVKDGIVMVVSLDHAQSVKDIVTHIKTAGQTDIL